MKFTTSTAILTGLSMLVIVSCGSATSDSQSASPAAQSVGRDHEVTFENGALTVHGSLRMPDDTGVAVPAVLLIAGSGPTDRNGDNIHVEGAIGTLSYFADVLARRGIASLRYDKSGTGATELDPETNPSKLGHDVYLHEAAAAANFLADRPGIDKSGVGLVGHSQGALVALALATDKAGGVPPITSLGLVQPQTARTLDIMMRQVAGLVESGQLVDADGADLVSSLNRAVDQIRTSGTIPNDLPEPLRSIGMVPAGATMLATQDELDPIAMAASLPSSMAVFTSCSDKDMQIRCVDVAGLNDVLAQTQLSTTHLDTANHVLKDVGDQPSTGAEYGEPLPFSQQFTDAFESWLSVR